VIKEKYRFLQIISIGNKIMHIARCKGLVLIDVAQVSPEVSYEKVGFEDPGCISAGGHREWVFALLASSSPAGTLNFHAFGSTRVG
jgi:hypothetical protein